MVFYFDKAYLFLSCLVFCCWHCCTFVESSTLWTDNRCEHFWSDYCFSAVMYVARCLLSWLLFAAAADFLVYFQVGSRDKSILLLTTGMMSLLFICIFVCIIFSVVNSRMVLVEIKEEELTDVCSVSTFPLRPYTMLASSILCQHGK